MKERTLVGIKKRIAKKSNLSYSRVTKVYNALVDVLREEISSSDEGEITLHNLCRLKWQQKKHCGGYIGTKGKLYKLLTARFSPVLKRPQ